MVSSIFFPITFPTLLIEILKKYNNTCRNGQKRLFFFSRVPEMIKILLKDNILFVSVFFYNTEFLESYKKKLYTYSLVRKSINIISKLIGMIICSQISFPCWRPRPPLLIFII